MSKKSHIEVRIEVTLQVKLKNEIGKLMESVSQLRVHCKFDLKSETAHQIARFLYHKIKKRPLFYK